MKTEIIKRLQRAIMTREIPDIELEEIAQDLEDSYDLIPSLRNGMLPKPDSGNFIYNGPTMLDVVKGKKAVESMRIEAIATPHYNSASWFQFATSVNNGGQKGEETMDTNYEARNRLNSRLRDAYAEKLAEARKTFFIDNDDQPKNGQELIDRLASGKYVYDKNAETKATERDGRWLYGMLSFITWRDPANKADRPGFDAWEDKLDKAFANAKDEIVVKDPKDGLETLRAFQALVVN